MIGYTIEMKGLEEQIKTLQSYELNADRRLFEAMQKSVMTIRSNVLPLVPVGVSARLKNSIGSKVVQEGSLSIVGTVGSSLKNEVYPAVMEFGREPGTFPPVDSLLRWVHLKLRPPENEERSVAFMVARKIYKHGIKGKRFFSEGWEKSKSQVQTYFAKALEKITEELSNGRS